MQYEHFFDVSPQVWGMPNTFLTAEVITPIAHMQ